MWSYQEEIIKLAELSDIIRKISIEEKAWNGNNDDLFYVSVFVIYC